MPHRFNPAKLERLNDPERLVDIPPAYIWEKLDMKDCRVMIDLGAGTGLFSRGFVPMMEDGTIYATDVLEEAVEWMNSNIVADYPGIIPMLMADSALPLDDAIAELAILINLYHELSDPAATLTDVHRALKPGGKVCVVDWKKIKTDHGPPIEHRFSPEEIARRLVATGYDDPQIDLSMRNHSMVWASKLPNASTHHT